MKMMCTKNEDPKRWFGKLRVTPGKIYDVVKTVNIPYDRTRPFDFSGPIYTVVDDDDDFSMLSDECLRRLNTEEERELKLKELGI